MDDELKAHLEAMERRLIKHIDERTHDAETRLLRAFSEFNVNLGDRLIGYYETRIQKLEQP